MKKNNLILTSAILGIISAVLATGIFFVNNLTATVIAESEASQLNSYYESVFPDSDYEVIYSQKDGDKDQGIISIATASNDGTIIGYLYLVSASGYSGDVVSLIGIDKDTSKIIKVIVSKQTETPGLGTKSTEPGFLDQFKEIDTGTTLKTKDNITAITGATISSNAVVKDVNIAFEDYNDSYKK